jgi:inorganic pyrophosphatase
VIIRTLEATPAEEVARALKLNDAGIKDWRLIAEHSNPVFQFMEPEDQEMFIKRLAGLVAQKRQQFKKLADGANTEEKKGRTKKKNSTGQKHQIDE